MQELWALMLEKTNSKPAEAVPGQKPTASAGKEAVKPEVSSSEYEEESSDTNGPAESEPPKATNVAAAKKAVDAVKEDKPAEQREDAQEEQPDYTRSPTSPAEPVASSDEETKKGKKEKDRKPNVAEQGNLASLRLVARVPEPKQKQHRHEDYLRWQMEEQNAQKRARKQEQASSWRDAYWQADYSEEEEEEEDEEDDDDWWRGKGWKEEWRQPSWDWSTWSQDWSRRGGSGPYEDERGRSTNRSATPPPKGRGKGYNKGKGKEKKSEAGRTKRLRWWRSFERRRARS